MLTQAVHAASRTSDRAPAALAFQPRPYQRDGIEAVRLAKLRGLRRQLLVLPTGAGKTVVFAHLIRRRAGSGRALVLAHREELLFQAQDKLAQVAPHLRIGIVKAGRDEHQDVDVVVGSVQTLASGNRLARIGSFSTVIVDEAHHAVAPTYRKVLEGLGCFDADGPLTVGVTATAGERADGVGLHNVFEEIVFSRGILFMIANAYLVDVSALEFDTAVDYAQVKTKGGDYTEGSLAAAMDAGGAIDAAAVAYGEHARDRRGVAFTPTIATADSLAAALRGLGIAAEAVSGETPGEDRRAILGRLHTGQTQVVTNCAVLTEGFDEPALSCALIARPTKSRPLFVQMSGRVLRPHPTKNNALILTMQAPPGEGLASITDLTGGDLKGPVRKGESLAEAAVRVEEEQARSATRLAARRIDLFARSKLRWFPVGVGFALPVKQAIVLLAPQDNDRWSVVEYRDGDLRPVQDGLSLEYAQGIGEEQARAAGALARSDAAWRERPATESQLATLARMRLPAARTRGAASDAISAASAERAMGRLVAVRGGR